MSIFEPLQEEVRGEAVGDWHPTRYTPPLTGSEEFTTQGDKLLAFAARYWSIAEEATFRPDPWQEWLVRHVLETYPDDWPVAHLRGQLRFRQVVVSMGRQNGKSHLAALLVIYLLCLHVRGPRIIGLASRDEQAHIVYDRVRYAIDNSEALTKAIRTTGTRGIWRRDGSGLYMTLPAKEDAAQGEPSTGAIYDELHLGLAALWDALVLSQRAKRNALLVGITTAGDDSSSLLIRLYREGDAAIAGQDERFGFFLWEAPSDELTEAGVIAANPAVACGRIPLDQAMADAWKMWRDQTKGPDGLTGRQRAIRYTLNRFIQGAADAWASTTAWAATLQTHLDWTEDGVVYGLDRTLDWTAAVVTATTYSGGITRTRLVAQLVNTDQDTLLEVCRLLGRRDGSPVFAMDARTLGSLGKTLREEGWEVWTLGDTEMHSAAQHGQAIINRHQVHHPGDLILARQHAKARRRTTGDSWRLSRSKSQGDVDAVIAFVTSAYVAHIRRGTEDQVF